MGEASNKERIVVAGARHVGLPVVMLPSQRNKVKVVDIAPERIDKLNRYESPIRDAEIERFLAEAKAGERRLDFTVTQDVDAAYMSTEYAVIATPINYDDETNSFNTSNVEAAITSTRKVNITLSLSSSPGEGAAHQRSLGACLEEYADEA